MQCNFKKQQIVTVVRVISQSRTANVTFHQSFFSPRESGCLWGHSIIGIHCLKKVIKFRNLAKILTGNTTKESRNQNNHIYWRSRQTFRGWERRCLVCDKNCIYPLHCWHFVDNAVAKFSLLTVRWRKYSNQNRSSNVRISLLAPNLVLAQMSSPNLIWRTDSLFYLIFIAMASRGRDNNEVFKSSIEKNLSALCGTHNLNRDLLVLEMFHFSIKILQIVWRVWKPLLMIHSSQLMMTMSCFTDLVTDWNFCFMLDWDVWYNIYWITSVNIDSYLNFRKFWSI